MAFLDWSTTAGSNTSIGGVGIQGGNNVQNFDNALRELMAQLKSGVDGKMTLLSKSAGYTAVSVDNNAVIRFTAASTLALTAAATLGSGWHCIVVADGADVVIDPNASETIDGSATLTVPNGYSALVICDGTNFRTDKNVSAFSNKADLLQPYVDVASASTTDIGAAASQNVRITGTTTITSLGTAAAGTVRDVLFSGILTVTHNATSLILQNNATNIVTAAGDTMRFVSLGSGNWRQTDWQRSIGASLTSWVAYTPTFTAFGTVTNISMFSRRVGDNLELRGRFTAGSGLVSEARMSLGFNGVDGGLTIDSTKNPTIRAAGVGVTSANGAFQVTPLSESGAAYITFGVQQSTTSGLNKINGVSLANSGDSISFVASVPITGW